MNPMTARGLGLGVAVAGWTIISHLTNMPLQLWPVLVGLGCFLAAGGGIPGLLKSGLGTLSGVAWMILYVMASRAMGRNEIVDALLLGAATVGMVLQARLPLLTFTAGALAGAGTALGVMGMRAVTFSGGVKVVIALAIGAGLGYAAEWISGMMKPGRG